MTENNALTPEQEARWDRAWDGATELDRHRFHHCTRWIGCTSST
jgi:hypothetical protein